MGEKNHDKFWEITAGKIFGETDTEEERSLEEMLRDNKNHKDFERAKEIHEKLQYAKPLQHVSPERTWEKVNRYLHQKKIRLFVEISKYAAVILLALFVGSLLNINWKSEVETPVFTEINVPLGQMSNITLYDGTQVWLNSGTSLKHSKDFGENSRNVLLDGEAYFKVKNDEIPFKVRLKNCEIEVLGTSFNAISFADENFSQVTLVEGSVKMNTLAGKEITQLKPAEQITLSGDLKDNSIKKVDTGFYRSWTEGKIVFHEERLADITQRLERWYNVEIKLNNPELGDLRFSGTILKNKPFDQIVKAFELLLPVKVKYENNLGKKDSVTISKK